MTHTEAEPEADDVEPEAETDGDQQPADGEGITPETAFMIVRTPGGQWMATTNVPFPVEREANLDDIEQGCHAIARDANNVLAATQVVNAIDQRAQQAHDAVLVDKVMSGGAVDLANRAARRRAERGR